jgi:hypothetical protein
MTISLHILYIVNNIVQSLLLHCCGLRVLKPIKIKLSLIWSSTLKKYAPTPQLNPKV